MATNNGSLAMATAAMPEVTFCSAKQTRPLPSNNSSTPVIAALRHCRRVGGLTPRKRSHAYIAMPAAEKRIAASANGGNPVNPIRMPRYVEPQITYTASNASGISQRRCGVAPAAADNAMSFMANQRAERNEDASSERRRGLILIRAVSRWRANRHETFGTQR